jgi:hypothetical protein
MANHTVRLNKAQRLQWLGQVERMNKMAMPKRMLQGKIHTTRKRGRPRLRWLEDVHDDLRKMKVKEWEGLMKNREEWRQIVQEAKAHRELQRGEGGKEAMANQFSQMHSDRPTEQVRQQ